MRLALPAAVAALLLVAITPTEAPAQRLVIGPLSVGMPSLFRRGVRRAFRPYAYRAHRPRVRAARHYVPRRAAIARAQQRQALPPPAPPPEQQALRQPQALPPPMSQNQATPSQQRQMAQIPLAQPEAFWPGASQDLFDYVLWSKDAGLRTHGYGAIVASMLAQPSRVAAERGESVTPARQAETTGSASAGEKPVCGEPAASRAEAATQQLRDTLALAGDEQRALAELRSALLKADKEIAAACPQGTPATVPDRLRAMQDRLWAIRVAATNLRAPLQKFHDSLTNEQKAKLAAQQPSNGESQSGAPAGAAAMLCQAQTQQAPQWPAEQVARTIRPNKDQRVGLEALSKTSAQMGMMMAGSCPQKAPTTVVVRLDATLDWLDAVLFAAANVAVPVDDFYRSLNGAQKAKLDTLSQ